MIHLYLGYWNLALCGQSLNAEHTINKDDDGITFGTGEGIRCPKCSKIFEPTARAILQRMTGISFTKKDI